MNALLTNPLPVILALIIGVLIGVLAALVFRSEPKPPIEAEPMPKKFAEKGYTEAMEEKNRISHRALAVKAALAELHLHYR